MSMAAAPSTGKGRARRRPMADINVTPLVDVVLVLLIIFMVTAPFLQGGLEIDLPKVASHGLDVHEGRVVKGVNFVNLRDAGDPVEAAIAYDAAGADELTFLDITASHENRGTLIDVVRRTAEVCFMPLTVGGGVRTLDDIRNLLLA